KVLLCQGGIVKVLGFGKILDLGTEGPLSETPAGGRRDSPYAAPEVARGLAAQPPADLYSLGLVLREMTGRPPHLPGRSETSPELDAVLDRATAADPATRYPSARAMLDDLARLPAASELSRGSAYGAALISERATEWAKGGGGVPAA